MRYLYRYPQAAFPYADLVVTNARRSRSEPEYELIDTGVFNDNRYFDVYVEVAKEQPDELLVRITAYNRGPDRAALHVLPTLWFRNTWAHGGNGERPLVQRVDDVARSAVIHATHPDIGGGSTPTARPRCVHRQRDPASASGIIPTRARGEGRVHRYK
jgi:hypothetical protein